MDYARQQRDPTKHVIGITFVVLMHLFVIYALMTGLGRTMMQIVKKPLSATIIEEVKLPPPPPPKKIELPKLPPPPPVETYVPVPDVPVISAPAGPTITVVTPKAPEPAPAPVVQAPPPPPPKPAVRRNVARVGGDDPVYPRSAMRAGVEKGRVLARVSIDEKGNVTNVVIVSAEPPKHFDAAVIDALKEWKFKAEGEKYEAEVEVNFTLKSS
jgi:protein TonB